MAASTSSTRKWRSNLPWERKSRSLFKPCLNPHAFPSRQTPWQILESTLGKEIALGGSQRNTTPFSSLSIGAITDQLHRAGFSRWGNERLYDGRTGEMVKSTVFMGLTFYQRLVHMSEDKVKSMVFMRHPLTRQPVADRKRFSGIKFGEMERDCLTRQPVTVQTCMCANG